MLDWDNDDMLRRKEHETYPASTDAESWEWGISNYWGNVLFRRCLQTASYPAGMLDTAMVQELLCLLECQDRIEAMTGALPRRHRAIHLADAGHGRYAASSPRSQYEDGAAKASGRRKLRKIIEQYPESYHYPMPFYIGTPSLQNGVLQLSWDTSYDFNAEDISYTVELARDYQFRQMVYREEHVVLPMTQTAAPAAGQYFIRVRATNASGYTQDAFDYYVIDSGKVYGVKCFYIQPDGTVVEDTYEE